MPYNKQADGEVYPKDSNGNEIIQDNAYAVSNVGGAYYPKKHDPNNPPQLGDEYLDSNLGLIERDGELVYPLKMDGKPNYRLDQGDEVYEESPIGTPIIGKDKDGNQVYAKKANGDYFYPSNNAIATRADGSPFYAVNANNVTIFPKKGNDEVYPFDINPDIDTTKPTKYAKLNNVDEYYPKALQNGLKYEYIISNAYAQKTINGALKKFYPKDAYNNEYYLPPTVAIADRVLDNYAVTNDGKVILPTNAAGALQTHVGALPATTASDKMGKLIRGRRAVGTDYLTSVVGAVPPGVDPIIYKYRTERNLIVTVTPANAQEVKIHTVPSAAISGTTPATTTATTPATTPATIVIPFFKKWYFWVLVVVSLIIKTFAIWWFFLKNKRPYTMIR